MRILSFALCLIAIAGLAADLALIQPADFAARVAARKAPVTILQVGPERLYRSKHIPGSVYAGPGGRPEGLELLKQAVAKLPRDREIVVYCGCCPWDRCPNIKPAMELLHQMGFTQAKAVYFETGWAQDWIDKNYPVEAGTPKQ